MLPVEVQEALKSGIGPAVLAAALGFAVHRSPARWQAGLAAFVVAVTYTAAQWWIARPAGFWPTDVAHWTPFLLVAASLVAMVPRDSRFLSFAAWFLMAGAVVAALYRPLASHSWSRTEAALWFAGTGAGLIFLWSSHMRPAREEARIHWVVAVVTVATAAAAGLGKSARNLELGVALGVILGVTALLNLFWNNARLARGFAVAGSVGLACHLLLNHHYGGITAGVALVLVAAWATHLVPIGGAAGRVKSALVPAAIALLVSAAALGWSYHLAQQEPENPYADFGR